MTTRGHAPGWQNASPPRDRLALVFGILAVGLLLPASNSVLAADASESMEGRVKSAFIYNYARFVEWPQSRGQGPFVIAVLGEDELRSFLEQTIQGKTLNGRPLRLIHLKSVSDSEAYHMLVIERSEKRHMKEIAQSLAGKPVLSVCDFDTCNRDGGTIGLQVIDESVRFSINLEAAEQSGLRISSQLLKLAVNSPRKRQ